MVDMDPDLRRDGPGGDGVISKTSSLGPRHGRSAQEKFPAVDSILGENALARVAFHPRPGDFGEQRVEALRGLVLHPMTRTFDDLETCFGLE